jgi:dipeptidyl aminopeptidase/acylaminoacyl peptidase
MKLTLFAAAALAVASASAAQAPADPALLFGVRDGVEDIDISPDGQHVAYLQPGPGRRTIAYLAEIGGTAAPQIVTASDGDPQRLRWCRFVTNDRLICQVTGMSVVESQLVPFSRLVAIDSNGRNVTLLGQHNSDYDARLRQFGGTIVDWLTPADGAVLMAHDYVPEAGRIGTLVSRTADGVGIDRVDIRTLHATPVERPNPRAAGYISDGQGHVRIMIVPSVRGSTEQLGTRIDYLYRIDAGHDWQPFASYDGATDEGVIPIAVDAGSNAAYVLKKLNGRLALYRVKLDGSMATDLVYANEHVDVDDVVRASHGSRVIGVTFAEEQRGTVYFDSVYAGLARSLGRAIPNLPLVEFGGASADGNRIVVHAASDTDAGRYYVYDRATHNLNAILIDRPQLDGVPPAPVRAVTYAAADGVSVPAYLTLPPNSQGRNLPAVVLPHGGPAARDERTFDWLVQYLAHQGYAVLQPNYRGSAGYGDQWLQENGFRGWRTSIGDITAGARWLAAQGIADPNRMAILGWSYGGYAALQSAATEPGLYKAVVAIAPVTDLQQAKDDLRGYVGRSNQADYIGTGPHVAEGSPLRHAAAITAPVLLFHGDHDLNVNVIHSRRMDSALRGAGRNSELTVFPGLEHDLADSEVRVRMLTRIGTFLAGAIGSAR